MLVEKFDTAYSKAKVEPKGIKISIELYRELKSANLIDIRNVFRLGIYDFGEKMPCYKNSLIIIDPELEFIGLSFLFPPDAV